MLEHLKKLITKDKAFSHKPKMGDIIYSLPFIQANGGGILYLDPVSQHFRGQEEHWRNMFKWLMPLLRCQEYLEDVRIYNGEMLDFDLDDYMDTTHLTKGDEVNIADNHFIGQGQKPIPYKKWLTVGHKRIASKIVANSDNHHDNIDYHNILKGDELFVGTEKEAMEFFHRSKVLLKNYVASDALELAEIINGADMFIGNQSLPLAIALGLGKKCYVEETPIYPNCIMGNYIKL